MCLKHLILKTKRLQISIHYKFKRFNKKEKIAYFNETRDKHIMEGGWKATIWFFKSTTKMNKSPGTARQNKSEREDTTEDRIIGLANT